MTSCQISLAAVYVVHVFQSYFSHCFCFVFLKQEMHARKKPLVPRVSIEGIFLESCTRRVPSYIKGTLRSNDATATRTSLQNLICVLSVFIAIIPNQLLCQMWANPPGMEFLETISKFRKRNKISPLLVYVLHKTPNQAFSRRSRAKTGKEMYKKA